MDRSPRLIFTPGDPSGVGPEVVLKALSLLREEREPSVTLIGPHRLWEEAAARLGLPDPADPGVEIDDVGDAVAQPAGYPADDTLGSLLFSGTSSPEGAALALAALGRAADLAETSPTTTAVITGPVCKRGLHDAGCIDPGQTEWFARRFSVESPVMLMVGGNLRVALLSTHLPLSRVAESLTLEGIVDRLQVLSAGLTDRFGIASPSIALLALNPHGGGDGEPGAEERELLEPAMEVARSKGLDLAGPFSADAFFGRRQWEGFDAVAAPYHDQGLIPVKMEAAGAGVNVTLGLPIVRTSPDHGTAFDIAGTGEASPEATVAAARLAVHLLRGGGAG